MMRLLIVGALTLAGCAAQAQQTSAPAAPLETRIVDQAPPPPAMPPKGQQWLYGSGEGAVASLQAYKAMTAHVLSVVKPSRDMSPNARSSVHFQMVLAPGSTPDNPKFEQCTGNKPFAAIFDADETLIWNVGAMRYMALQGKDFDPIIWDKWEKTGAGKALAMPGAVEALKAMRDAGVTIVANTNRTAENAKGTEDALRAAGLGEFKHGETLFLMGDTPGGSDKDGRRAAIASKYCVIAMAGDQLGDFSHTFNAKDISPADRKKLATHPAITPLWGSGWFLFSNPVYGPSIRGGYDDIFSADTHWAPTFTQEPAI
jgi:5'-nucleotidase (lipoprotein e(P4) family)